jgi:hypothetical protein
VTPNQNQNQNHLHITQSEVLCLPRNPISNGDESRTLHMKLFFFVVVDAVCTYVSRIILSSISDNIIPSGCL